MKATSLCLLLAACGDTDRILERPCIESINIAPVTVAERSTLVLTETCAGAQTRIEKLVHDGDGFITINAIGTAVHARATRIVDLDGTAPTDIAAVVDDGFGYVAWSATGGTMRSRHVGYERSLADIASARVDDDTFPDVIVAGDGAIRIALGNGMHPSTVLGTDEVEAIGGKAFASVTVLRRLGRPAIAYVATSPAFELGIAGASAQDALVYETVHAESIADGEIVPIIAADVDDDNFDDAITATTSIFIYSSRHDRVLVLDEDPLAIAAGDVDGDGDAEPIFLSGDGRRVARIQVAQDGTLSAVTVIETDASAFAVGDLDGDGGAEIAVVEGGLGTASTRVVVY